MYDSRETNAAMEPQLNSTNDSICSKGPDSGPIFSQIEDEDMKELVEMFVSELPDRVASYQDAYQKKDWQALSMLAHQMKSAAVGYGFPSISEAAASLEKTLKSGDDYDKASDQVEVLINLCSRAKVESDCSV